MEMGRAVITTEHLAAFARVLRVDPSYFYGENEAPPYPANLADEASKLVAALSPTGQKYARDAAGASRKRDQGRATRWRGRAYLK